VRRRWVFEDEGGKIKNIGVLGPPWDWNLEDEEGLDRPRHSFYLVVLFVLPV